MYIVLALRFVRHKDYTWKKINYDFAINLSSITAQFVEGEKESYCQGRNPVIVMGGMGGVEGVGEGHPLL